MLVMDGDNEAALPPHGDDDNGGTTTTAATTPRQRPPPLRPPRPRRARHHQHQHHHTSTTVPVACPGRRRPLPVGSTIAVDVFGTSTDGADDGSSSTTTAAHLLARVELSYGYAAVAPTRSRARSDQRQGGGLGGGRTWHRRVAGLPPVVALATFYAMYDCDLAAATRDGDEIAQFPLRGSAWSWPASLAWPTDRRHPRPEHQRQPMEVSTMFYQWCGLGSSRAAWGRPPSDQPGRRRCHPEPRRLGLLSP